MKKIYIKPNTDTVNVRLYSSVLDDPGMGNWSDGTNELGAKENNLLFEDDDDFGDIWGTDEDPNDLWGED